MTPRTRTQMLDETHDLLVGAGRRYFGTTGYTATSMDDLTASVGLTRGALYHHFGGKSGLLAAVVSAVDTEIDARLEEVSARESDPLGVLTQRCLTYVELTQAPDVQQIIFQDAPAVLPAAVETSTAACVRSIAGVVSRAQDAGLVRPDASPDALAVLINGALADASRWIAAAPEPDRAERHRDATAGVLMLIGTFRAPS